MFQHVHMRSIRFVSSHFSFEEKFRVRHNRRQHETGPIPQHAGWIPAFFLFRFLHFKVCLFLRYMLAFVVHDAYDVIVLVFPIVLVSYEPRRREGQGWDSCIIKID